ncbi:hypothetical protein SKC41_23710 [Mycobacterium sp. 050128]|uniref:hypothetical protein n=1 Tax=Mycobacterium sp. 050128 TaxID=3096112 RepID=UPI002EDBAC7D
MQILNFSWGRRGIGPLAVAAMLSAPLALLGAPSAHAATGIVGYAECVGGDTKPPPPGVNAEFWFPSVHIIQNDLDSGIPSAQVTQILVNMGVSPADAAKRVQCYLANQPRGQGH